MTFVRPTRALGLVLAGILGTSILGFTPRAAQAQDAAGQAAAEAGRSSGDAARDAAAAAGEATEDAVDAAGDAAAAAGDAATDAARAAGDAASAAGEAARDAAAAARPVAEKGGSLLLALFSWLVVGLVIGAVAKLLMPGPDGGGIVLTSLLGIAGALVGGILAGAIGLGSYAEPSLGGFVVAVLGAMLLLGGRRILRRAA